MKTPPRLVARTLVVTFVTVAVILLVVFIVLTLDVRDRVRAAETDKLQVSENVFTALEAQAPAGSGRRDGDAGRKPDAQGRARHLRHRAPLQRIVRRTARARPSRGEIEKLAAQTPRTSSPSSTPTAGYSPAPGRRGTLAGGQKVDLPAGASRRSRASSVLPAGAFRVTGARLTLRRSRHRRAGRRHEPRRQLRAGAVEPVHAPASSSPSTTIVARTVPETSHATSSTSESTHAARSTLDGEEYAVRDAARDGPGAHLHADVDRRRRAAATRERSSRSRTIAFGGFVLAALGSLWLARMLTEPINRVVERDRDDDGGARLRPDAEPTGTSRELDALTNAFNELMRGLTAAEAETRAAYLGAIRALAAALDARDPYTAGHSERVSALSVMMGRG